MAAPVISQCVHLESQSSAKIAESVWVKSDLHVSSQQLAVESYHSSANPVDHKDLSKLGTSIIVVHLIQLLC